jgi:hypothetical protein
MQRRIFSAFLACGLCCGFASPGLAQLLRGPELVINAVRAGRQSTPDVAVAADGRFVVVWVSGGLAGAPSNVMARLFTPEGVAKTADLRVSTTEAGFQAHPRVATAADGRFVVVWSSRTSAQGPSRVYGRLFRADGKASGQRFLLSTSPREQFEPDVARTPDGRFVAAWTEFDGAVDPETGDPTTNVVARRFGADGKPAAKEWTAAGGRLYQYSPAVAMNAAGAFAIAFEQLAAPAGTSAWDNDVFGLVYGADAKLRSSLVLPAAQIADKTQRQAAIAMAADGSCVLAWADSQGDAVPDDFWESPAGILAQRFDAKGARVGTLIHVDTSTLDVQSEPALALAPDGGFLVAWTSAGWQDGDSRGVFTQRFAANGAKIGAETPLATWVTGNQSLPAMAASPQGRAVVVWQSAGNDGSDLGVAGRRAYLK